MATNLEQSLERISRKSRFLTDRYRAVAAKLAQSRQQIAELQAELSIREKENQRLAMQVEYLTLASTVAPDRESLEKTRAMISNIVREIDRCIADLNE